MAAAADAIRALVEPPLASSGLEVWDIEVTPDTVRVLIDRPGGVDLESLATLAGKVVSPLLDDHPDLTPAGQFSLEVSSPGVERPLRTVDHFRRYVGSEVSVKTSVPVDGARRHQGVLAEVDEGGIVLSLHEPPGRTVSVSYADIDRARTVLVWGPAPKPGANKGNKKAKNQQPAVKRPAANGRTSVVEPVASREKETE